jgi:DNA-binding CsgD family transcriptional regulator
MTNPDDFATQLADLRRRAAALAAPSVDGAANALIADLLAALAALTEELATNEERFRIVTEIAGDVVYERDFDTGIARFFGDVDTPQRFAKGEYPRTRDGWADLCHPDDVRASLEAAQETFRTRQPVTVQMRLRRKDGGYATWLDRGAFLWGANGQPTKWIGVATDISEKLQAEAALRENEKKLQEQNELLQQRAAALRELIEQLKTERRSLEDQVRSRFDQSVRPMLQKAKETLQVTKIREFLEIIDESLRSVTSSLGEATGQNWDSLSRREVEVSQLIRDGLPSKRIAELLGISCRSVATHRRNIRRKLGLRARKINLPTYLRKFK